MESSWPRSRYPRTWVSTSTQEGRGDLEAQFNAGGGQDKDQKDNQGKDKLRAKKEHRKDKDDLHKALLGS